MTLAAHVRQRISAAGPRDCMLNHAAAADAGSAAEEQCCADQGWSLLPGPLLQADGLQRTLAQC